MLLRDKVAVITGAGRGIGRATALAFAQQGASVVVNDWGVALDGTAPSPRAANDVVEEIVDQGGRAVADSSAVHEPGSAHRLIELARSTYGKLDILINNAAIAKDKGLLALDEQDFEAVLRVTLNGSFACLQAAAKVMKKAGTGSIINTMGLAGLQGNFGRAAAATAEAGIYGLTRTASVELQRYGIRVNAVVPLAKTRMTEHLPMFENVDSMGAEHVTPVHVFLASDLAAGQTGVVVAVAGGRLSSYRLVESAGEFRDADDGRWTAEQIAQYFGSIRKI